MQHPAPQTQGDIATLVHRLGHAGLIPFVGLAALMWLVAGDVHAFVAMALSAYAATIAAFLGGIHCGTGLPLDAPARPFHLVWGVVPSLVAWVALLIALCVPLCNVAAVWPLARHGGHDILREIGRNPLILATVATVIASQAVITGAFSLTQQAVQLGLLPRIQDIPVGGKDGEGDRKIQAYNFRMCLTKVDANRVPFPRPAGYDPKQYALLARALQQGATHVFGKFDLIPNAKTDTNNHGPFSTDNIGMNWDYPDASYERRREIIAEHRQYQQGYLYFLANDASVPAKIREGFAQWGLAKDEFTDNGHWPHQIYVREARRMTADVVVNENHLKRKIPTPRSVGMGSYNMDSHNVQRIVVKDADGKAYVRNEGDVQVNPGRPYPIEYGSIIPKKDQCTNLLVPVCVSCTHIAYGSIRMEPVFMILGQSAATAASLAIDQKIAVQDVAYADLSAKLLADGQVLDRAAGPKAIRREGKELPGITVDDADAKVTGTWTESVASTSFIGTGYRHDAKGEHGPATARFEAKLSKPGKYEIFLALVPNINRATNAPVTIAHAGGNTVLKVNLRDKTANNLLSLGVYTFDASHPASVTIGNQDADGYIVIDAVNWVPKP